MKLKLDDWQQKVMDTKGNICLRSGRQVGKSTVVSILAAEFAAHNPGKTVIIIANVQRAAIHLFLKIQSYLHDNYPKLIKKRMTLSYALLKNKAQIHCLPAGDTGEGVRGFTVDLLIADEAAYIKETVWTAITPMLAVTRGKKILLSTPHGKQGYFYRCFDDESYTSFHVSAEDCPRKDEKHLAQERKRMTKTQYATEYLGEFIDELRQFFPTDLINKCCVLGKETKLALRKYFMGVDIARMGKDETTFEIFDGTNKSDIIQVDSIIKTEIPTNKTEDIIKNLSQSYESFGRKSIGIDSAGVGGGVYDHLLLDSNLKRKVVSIENATKSLDRNGKTKKILKEDLYNNLKGLMQRGEIQLLDDEELKLSLSNIQCEQNESGRNIFWGVKDHIVEGIVRGAWLAKAQSLSISKFYKNIY